MGVHRDVGGRGLGTVPVPCRGVLRGAGYRTGTAWLDR